MDVRGLQAEAKARPAPYRRHNKPALGPVVASGAPLSAAALLKVARIYIRDERPYGIRSWKCFITAVSVHRTAAEQHTEQRGSTMIGRPFKKGQSGNPGGRPKVVAEIRHLARERGPEAIAALVMVMKEGKSEAARVAAATALLDRGWGRPMQSDETEVTYRYVVELPRILNKEEWLEKYGRSVEPTAALEPTQ